MSSPHHTRTNRKRSIKFADSCPGSPTVIQEHQPHRFGMVARSSTLATGSSSRPRAPVVQASARSTGQGSMIPVWKTVPIQPRARGTLPPAWIPVPTPVQRAGSAEHRRTASEPVVRATPDLADYPRLSTGERTVLMSKLRMLLSCMDMDAQLDEREPARQIETRGSARRVFGAPVPISITYANCKVILGEYTHHLPTCIFASIEEICQRGLDIPALFRLTPCQDKRTLEQLTHIYDSGPNYGHGHSLAREDVSNVCAVLKLFLRGLPEPVFESRFWGTLCRVTSDDKGTKTCIAAIQAMFHLQDRSAFSTLVYVLAFLCQLVLHGPQNGLTIPIVSEMFGPALFSPRTQSSGCSVGVVLGHQNQRVPAWVKTYRSANDRTEGARVLGWILERWDGISAGLLDVDVARNGEDVAEWGARFMVERRSSEVEEQRLNMMEEIRFGLGMSVEQVRVRRVSDSLVEVTEVPPRPTRASSPATVWSQDSMLPKELMSRTGSVSVSIHSGPEPEPTYVIDLRRRMERQESELVALRRELTTIRERFVFPIPPGDIPPGPDEEGDLEDTPRPPSASRFEQPPTPTSTATMRELVDSLQLRSEPPSPLFDHILGRRNQELMRGEVFSDLVSESGSSSSSSGHGSGRTFFVANPDSESESEGEDLGKGRKLSELFAARDALKSALAAMTPVQVQLSAVEKELRSRVG